jgi:hypothetical protein
MRRIEALYLDCQEEEEKSLARNHAAVDLCLLLYWRPKLAAMTIQIGPGKCPIIR